MKSLISVFLLFLFLAVSIVSYFFMDMKEYAQTPMDKGQAERVIVIRPGQGFNTVLRRLTESGIVNDALKFTLVARFKGYDRNLKPGEYQLSSAMSPLKILQIINEGRTMLKRITIPEGYSIYQIASIIDDAGICDKDAFIKLATDSQFAGEKGIDAETLEGYLFPDTYYVSNTMNPEAVITILLNRFQEIFTPEWKSRAEEKGLSVHEVVTLASIVEKETGVDSERPLIASVFFNRLKHKMRLQSDPTVIYGIPDFNGNLTKKDLETHTPYNTYRINGLPPGPIANPGKEALKAVLYPAETSYLYFVAKGDKTHEFSNNLKEHNRAVRKYQLK